ncbi:hypothetical protein R69927_06009 [Paraburkholderia domus]|nr:hypothetical protein R69927_06009 [Paraburkholderia domus]
MRLVAVVKYNGQVLQCGSDVRLGHPRNVVSLYRLDEALGHHVALWTSEKRRDRLKTDFPRERQRFLGNVAGTVIVEPLDFAVGLQRTIETVLHRLKYHLTHHIPGVATRRRSPVMASRSQQSSAKMTRNRAPSSQRNSKPSEHQRALLLPTETLPSCRRQDEIRRARRSSGRFWVRMTR